MLTSGVFLRRDGPYQMAHEISLRHAILAPLSTCGLSVSSLATLDALSHAIGLTLPAQQPHQKLHHSALNTRHISPVPTDDRMTLAMRYRRHFVCRL